MRPFLALSLAAITLLSQILYAPPVPSWWSARGVLNPNASPDDHAALNQGQLKNLARATFDEMQAVLPGGAGQPLADLIASWGTPTSNTDDFLPVNQGQLKALAEPFYQRLESVRASLAPDWPSIHLPWQHPGQPNPGPADHHALANIGQAKRLFAGLEGDRYAHGDLSNPSTEPNDYQFGIAWLKDSTSTGTPDYEQITLDTSPVILQILSGGNQTMTTGSVSPSALIVQALRSENPVPNVGVVFQATGGGLALSSAGPFQSAVTTQTASNGTAAVYWAAPEQAGTYTLQAETTGTSPASTQSTVFIATTSDGGGPGGPGGPGENNSPNTPEMIAAIKLDIASIEAVSTVSYTEQAGHESWYAAWDTPAEGSGQEWGSLNPPQNKALPGTDDWPEFIEYHSLNASIDSISMHNFMHLGTDPDDGFYRSWSCVWRKIQLRSPIPLNEAFSKSYIRVEESQFQIGTPLNNHWTDPVTTVTGIVELTIPKNETESNIIELTPATSFHANGLGELKSVSLLPIDLAIDANRDGTIASGETASQDKPLRFWINNDSDIDANKESIGTFANSDDGSINTIRDLEDMQLLKLELPSDFYPKIQDGTSKIGFKWSDTSGGTPAVKLFRTSADISDFSYLTNVAKAEDQLTNPSTQISYGTIQGGAVTWLPATALFAPGANPTTPSTQPHPFLLFEGHERGSGRLTLVLQINGQQVDGPGVWLKLVDVKKMFDKAKGAPGSYPNPPEYTDQEPPRPGVGVDSEDMGEPFEAEPDEKNEAIILVHGWNMTDGDWRVFSETFFKRLWWKGYKGRFYTFGWPTYNSDHDTLGFLPTHYNKSEYVAWKYGPALKAFVDGIPKGTKNVAAHSMGNVVMASALKSGLTVNSYVAMQAALPAGCYDESDDVNSYADFVDANTADPTPDRAIPNNGYRGVMAGIPTGNFHNFFSAEDYALKTGTKFGIRVSWEGNQISYKPNGWGNLYYDYDPDAPVGQCNQLWRAGNGPGGHDIARYATDHHEIMSFIARPLSEALGARTEATTGFEGFDLAAEIPEYGFGRARTDHSGQFQRPIQKTEVFYKMLLRKMGAQFNDDN